MTATLFQLPFDELREGEAYDSPPRQVSESDVDVFAALTGDHHPVHTDPEWAARSPFGGRIAHGMLVLSCAIGSLPLDPERVLALRRIRDATFKRPLAVGEQIHVQCKVTGTRPLDDRTGLVECEWRIAGDDGRLRARALVEVLWRREGTGARVGAAARATEGEAGEGSTPRSIGIGEWSGGEQLAPIQVGADGMRVLI